MLPLPLLGLILTALVIQHLAQQQLPDSQINVVIAFQVLATVTGGQDPRVFVIEMAAYLIGLWIFSLAVIRRLTFGKMT